MINWQRPVTLDISVDAVCFCVRLSSGDPATFLPILNFTLTSFSPPFAEQLVAAGLELTGKTDLRFTDTLYKVTWTHVGCRKRKALLHNNQIHICWLKDTRASACIGKLLRFCVTDISSRDKSWTLGTNLYWSSFCHRVWLTVYICCIQVLRDIFNYKPVLTKQQFLQCGFAQRKISFICDIINLVLQRHKQLHKVRQTPRENVWGTDHSKVIGDRFKCNHFIMT